jgi:16S rRNA (cytosine967-C5)-methyltransferase
LHDAWTVAIEALSWIDLQRLNEDAALSRTAKQLGVTDSVVRGEAKRLIYGVERRLNAIDFLLGKALEPAELGDLIVGLRCFLRLYAHLVQFEKISYLEANDLIEHGLKLFKGRSKREIVEALEVVPTIRLSDYPVSEIDGLAYSYNHPAWYVRYLLKNFSHAQATRILTHVDVPYYIRVNTLKPGGQVVKRLQEIGYQLRREPVIRDTYRVLDGEDIGREAARAEGYFIVQDKASVLAGEVADPRPGDTVLDVCAAPGVKTSHMAQLMGNTGRIISVDYHGGRLKAWELLTRRMGVANAEAVQVDATRPRGLPAVEADVVLVDPPCTGTGIFHESPSSKWRLTAGSVERMAEIQWRILSNAATHVKLGGSLVYSTCSVTVEENEGVVLRLLDEQPDFRLIEAQPRIGSPGLEGLEKAQRLYPYLHGCAGFFVAKLIRC